MTRKAVFVDRDGTLIEEVNFLSRTEDLRLFPFTNDAATLLKQNGYLLIVVSNQSGVGRNLFDERAVQTIHDTIQKQLSGKLDGLYFCPHLPDEGCKCRKPSLGMIEAAVKDFSIDLAQSWMIGDKKIDIETGFNGGIRTALVKTGYGAEHLDQLSRPPDVVAENLLEAAKQIIKISNGHTASVS
jgi:D-glycero-D-manno-heptose 1,7-bisphosphate phosphatase